MAVEKRAGVYAVFFTFVSRKIRFYFLVIPKKQINPVCDRIFVACFCCKYTYTAMVICMSDLGGLSVFFLFVGSNFCLGYLKRFMIENRGYENSNCLHHNWGVLFAHMRFLMGKI